MAEKLGNSFGGADVPMNPELAAAYGEQVVDFEKVRALKQKLGEAALEAVGDESVFQLPQMLGQVEASGLAEKPVEGSSVGEQMGDSMRGAVAKAEAAATREVEKSGLAAETDRNGNPAYSQATLARLEQAGVTESPAELAQREAAEAAQAASYERAQAEVADILRGRSVEQTLNDLNSDIAGLQAEIDAMGQRMYFDPVMQEAHQRMMNDALGALAEMQRKQAVLIGTQPIELPAAPRLEALPAPGESVMTADEMVEIPPEMEPGETDAALLDLMTPEQRTGWQIRRAAAEAAVQNGDLTPLEHLKAVEAAELEQLRENGFASVEGGMPEGAGAIEEIEAVSENGEQELSAEERESLRSRLLEKLKDKLGWNKVTRAAAKGAAMIALAVLSLTGVVLAPAVASAAESASVQQVVDLDKIPGIGLSAENFGDVARDLRLEQANGTRYDYGPDYDSQNKGGENNFGTDKTEFYGDREGTASALLEICRNQPETLAATVSAYPSILEACGLDGGMTAVEIDDLLSNGDNGGEMQQKLLDALAQKLEDEGTQFEFYEEHNTEKSYYMYNMKGRGSEETPATMGLQAIRTHRNGEKQVRITVPVLDANGNVVRYEEGDFNMPCGFQLNLEYDDPEAPVRTIPDVPVVEVPSTPIPETPVETPEVPVTPEAPETPEEPAPETPVETPEAPEEPETPEAPVTPEKPETPAPETPEPETPTPTPTPEPEPESPKLKNEENEQRVVDNGGQVPDVVEIENVYDMPPVQTDTELAPPVGNEQTAGENARPDQTLNPIEQAAASEAQQEANHNENRTEKTDNEFTSMVDSILNAGGTQSTATGTESVQVGGGADEGGGA